MSNLTNETDDVVQRIRFHNHDDGILGVLDAQDYIVPRDVRDLLMDAVRAADKIEVLLAREQRLLGFVDWVRDVSTDANLDAVREQARKTMEALLNVK